MIGYLILKALTVKTLDKHSDSTASPNNKKAFRAMRPFCAARVKRGHSRQLANSA